MTWSSVLETDPWRQTKTIFRLDAKVPILCNKTGINPSGNGIQRLVIGEDGDLAVPNRGAFHLKRQAEHPQRLIPAIQKDDIDRNRPETSVMKSVTVKITALFSTATSSGAVSELYWNRCPSGRVPAQLADAPSGIWYSTEWLYRTQRIFLERWSNCLTWTTVGTRFSVKGQFNLLVYFYLCHGAFPPSTSALSESSGSVGSPVSGGVYPTTCHCVPSHSFKSSGEADLSIQRLSGSGFSGGVSAFTIISPWMAGGSTLGASSQGMPSNPTAFTQVSRRPGLPQCHSFPPHTVRS